MLIVPLNLFVSLQVGHQYKTNDATVIKINHASCLIWKKNAPVDRSGAFKRVYLNGYRVTLEHEVMRQEPIAILKPKKKDQFLPRECTIQKELAEKTTLVTATVYDYISTSRVNKRDLQKKQLFVLPRAEMDMSCYPSERIQLRHLRDMLQDLSQLHLKKYLHGDIKPANILMFGEEARLIDFDSVCTIEDNRRSVGTSCYLPFISLSSPYCTYGDDLYALALSFIVSRHSECNIERIAEKTSVRDLMKYLGSCGFGEQEPYFEVCKTILEIGFRDKATKDSAAEFLKQVQSIMEKG